MRNTDPARIIQWEAFRAQMRARRLALGLTQTEVAERMGRSQDFVSVLENMPESIPNLVTVWLWTEALDGRMRMEWDDDQAQLQGQGRQGARRPDGEEDDHGGEARRQADRR